MKCEYCKGDIPAIHFYRWHYTESNEDGMEREIYHKCDKHFQKAKNMGQQFFTHHMVELSPEEIMCFEVLGS
jgi:hypothetical protein